MGLQRIGGFGIVRRLLRNRHRDLMIIQLTPFGKGSNISIRFNCLLTFMVSLRTFSLFFRITRSLP